VRLTVSAAGAAEPGDVWDRYVRPARWSQWSPQIRSVDYPDEVIATGGSGTVHGPCGLPVRFEVLDVDGENRCWSWAVTLAMVRLTLQHRVAARGSGTITELVVDGPAPVVLGYAPIARIALGRLVRAG
jgi:hypothetical protein